MPNNLNLFQLQLCIFDIPNESWYQHISCNNGDLATTSNTDKICGIYSLFKAILDY